MRSGQLVMAGACLIIAMAGIGLADDDRAFEFALKNYETAKNTADKKMAKLFDVVAGQIRANRNLPPETRNRHIIEIQDQKELFLKYNQLPESDVMLPGTIAYLNCVYGKSASLQRQFGGALERAVGDRAEFHRISVMKENVQSTLPGRSSFGMNTRWHGNRTFMDGRVVDFHVHITRGENNSFEGEIWQNVQITNAKLGWAFEGKLDGNAIELVTTKTLYGKTPPLDLRGFVVGHRLVFAVCANGNPVNDFISVVKK